MEDHIRALLHHFQYSEQLKETAAFRIVFWGEAPSQVMADLDIHNRYTLRNRCFWRPLFMRPVPPHHGPRPGVFFAAWRG